MFFLEIWARVVTNSVYPAGVVSIFETARSSSAVNFSQFAFRKLKRRRKGIYCMGSDGCIHLESDRAVLCVRNGIQDYFSGQCCDGLAHKTNVRVVASPPTSTPERVGELRVVDKTQGISVRPCFN